MSDSTSPNPSEAGDGRVRKDVFAIIEREGKKAYFLRLGSAWINRDGSMNLLLDALPKDGKLHVRDPRPVEG